MSSQNKTFISITILMLLVVSILTYFFFRQPAVSSHSLLLYRNYPSPEVITNWVIDTDTGEKWEVGNGLSAGHWSPLGKHIAFNTLSPLPFEIWVSDNKGNNIRQVFNSNNYPDLKIKNYDWLTDEIIIVNAISKLENSGFVYLLNINTLLFEKHNPGNFVQVSPNGKIWIQWAGQYELSGLSEKTIPMSDYLSDYYFSPLTNKIAYSCAGQYKYSSLCIADVSISGITNAKKVTEDALLNAYGEMFWSLDGKYIGFLYFHEETEKTRFKAIDVSSGFIAYDWEFPTQTTRNFWSPDNSKVIDYTGLLLDLETGEIRNFFEDIGEANPSQIVDWRLIETP